MTVDFSQLSVIAPATVAQNSRRVRLRLSRTTELNYLLSKTPPLLSLSLSSSLCFARHLNISHGTIPANATVFRPPPPPHRHRRRCFRNVRNPFPPYWRVSMFNDSPRAIARSLSRFHSSACTHFLEEEGEKGDVS